MPPYSYSPDLSKDNFVCFQKLNVKYVVTTGDAFNTDLFIPCEKSGLIERYIHKSNLFHEKCFHYLCNHHNNSCIGMKASILFSF